MAQVTRLWPYGGPGHQYGSFAGKTEQIIVDAPASTTGGDGRYHAREDRDWRPVYPLAPAPRTIDRRPKPRDEEQEPPAVVVPIFPTEPDIGLVIGDRDRQEASALLRALNDADTEIADLKERIGLARDDPTYYLLLLLI